MDGNTSLAVSVGSLSTQPAATVPKPLQKARSGRRAFTPALHTPGDAI